MKKIASILAMLLMAIVISTAMVGCGGLKSTAAFNQMKSRCPMDMGNGLTLTDVEQDGNNSILVISAPNASKSALAAAKPELLSYVKSQRGLVKSMQKEQATLTMRFVCSDGTADVSISPSDLDASELYIRFSTLKSQCPMDMGNGLTLTDIEQDGNNAIIIISAPTASKSAAAARKPEFLNIVKNQPEIVQLMQKEQTSFTVRFLCSDGTTDVSISPSDLDASEIDVIVSTLKSQCPMSMGDGMTLTNAVYSGNNAIITISVPNASKSSFNNKKSSMLESVKKQTALVSALKKSQTTLIYRYECSDGTTDITILPSDL